MKKIIQAVKGTRDFYPEQMATRTWLYNILRSVAESFGYQEYEAPILELLELYAAKSGEELVVEQSYVFSDRGGSEIVLRPELTLSLARMIAQKQKQITFPIRWWSFGPFWRYERPQKGRSREFFQWNVDLLGVDTPEADAENAAVLATFFQRVGLRPDQVIILVNDRRLIDSRLTASGIPKDQRSAIFSWVDRRTKISLIEWEKQGKEIGLSAKQIVSINSILEDKDLWKRSESMIRFLAALEALGVGEYFRFDPSVVRGLLYYTGTVFEAWEVGGDIKRSILGGGRYDNLLTDVGGDPLPAVGFAMGDVVITLILEKYGLLPKNLSIQPASLLVTVFDKNNFSASLKLANELRSGGLNVICYPESIKLGKQFKYADRIGIPWVAIYGPNEILNDTVSIKSLKTGNQLTLSRKNIVIDFRKILASDKS
jgi:histidyl-tRNA synthetase